MSDLLKNIDARTRLAGTNRLEVLMFSLGLNSRTGRNEVFGINVFKVREVMRAPEITRPPEMRDCIEGMVSLRGVLVPVIDLSRYAGVQSESKPEIMIVTEYNGHTQGFLVVSVDNILRLDWSDVRVPPDMLTAQMGGLVTAVTELKDGRLVMMVDVEKILAETRGQEADDRLFDVVRPIDCSGRTVFFADDSSVARKQIERTLKSMGVNGISATNGREAWESLCHMADHAESLGNPLIESIQLILTDVEMPEMDGYMLTKKVKDDCRFSGIPVVMHSSLSGNSNLQLGKTVGVDAYVSKFEPKKLSAALAEFLS